MDTIYFNSLIHTQAPSHFTPTHSNAALETAFSPSPEWTVELPKTSLSPATESMNYLSLEREADAEALIPQNTFKDEESYRSHLQKVANKYQTAAEMALLQGDREKVVVLLKKSTEIWEDQFYPFFGVDDLERAIAKIESTGKETLAAELNLYLLNIIDKKLKHPQGARTGEQITPHLVSYWIKKADLLGKIGIEKSLRKQLYLQAAEAYLRERTTDDYLREPRWAHRKFLAPILYEKAGIDPSLLKQKYQETYEMLLEERAKELLEIQEDETWLDNFLSEIEQNEEILDDTRRKFPKDDPRRYDSLHLYYPILCGQHQMLDFFAYHSQKQTAQMQWIEKEFGYDFRILKLLLPREEGVSVPSEKWNLKVENDVSTYMFARFFALGDFLTTYYYARHDSIRAAEFQAKMDLLKPLLQRYPDALKKECEKFFQDHQSLLQSLFSPTLMERGTEEIFEIVVVW